MRKTNFRIGLLTVILVCVVLCMAACGADQAPVADLPTDSDIEYALTVSGDGIEGQIDYDLEKLAALPDSQYEHIYSVINNWPTKKKYVAKGFKVSSILADAGVLESFQTVTFKSADGYKVTLTKDQLLGWQYYYPGLETDSVEGEEAVEAIIAYEYLEGSADMSAMVPDSFCFVVGQRNIFEHNNPAFVKSVSEIVVSSADPGAWDVAVPYPEAGKLAAGEKVKLEHDSFGLVKIFYTLDGSEPTIDSAMYNPSTYQPELNVPITLEQDTTIKVLVYGYGKKDSAVATYDFQVQ